MKLPRLFISAVLAPLLSATGCLFHTRTVEVRLSNAKLQSATQQELIDRLNQEAARIQTLNATVDIERDAAIQRFEFCFEATWKAAQLFLSVQEGIEAGSPKAVIRAALQSGVLSEDETRHALVMADDHNLTVHTYNEALAKRIFADLAGHAAVLERWLSAMEQLSFANTLTS